MSDELKLYKGTDLPSSKDLSFSGTSRRDYFDVFRGGPPKKIIPLEQLFHHNSFNLFGTRRAASDLPSRGKLSTDLSSQHKGSTLTSVHELKLKRYIYDGDTVKPLQIYTQDLQVQNIENSSLAEKLHDSKKRSSVPQNSEPNSSHRDRKCLELLKKKSTIAIIGAVLLFLLIVTVALGVGIYFGVTNKSPDKTTTAWQNNTYHTSSFTPNTTSQFSTVFVNHTTYQFNNSITTMSQHSDATTNATDLSSGQTNQATTTTQTWSSSRETLTTTQALTSSQVQSTSHN